MGLPVTVYRSSDVGAPVIKCLTSDDLLAVFKACLVSGYGTKPSLGWTKVDESATSVVYQNKISDGGSGGAVQFDKYDTNKVYITCANSILSINAAVRRVGKRMLTSSSTTSNTSGWTLIGTSRGFWFSIEGGTNSDAINNMCSSSTTGQYQPTLFIGDIESYMPNDSNCFTLVSSSYNNAGDDSTSIGATTFISATQISSNPSAQLYATDGSNASATYNSISGGNSLSAGSGVQSDPTASGAPFILQPQILIRDAGANLPLPSVRGKFPGLFRSYTSGFSNIPIPIFRTLDGVEYKVVTGYYVSIWLIQSSGEWYD